jgi:hypothetical protein
VLELCLWFLVFGFCFREFLKTEKVRLETILLHQTARYQQQNAARSASSNYRFPVA